VQRILHKKIHPIYDIVAQRLATGLVTSVIMELHVMEYNEVHPVYRPESLWKDPV
jgi:hypothetical protein